MFTCTLDQYVAHKTNVAQQFTPQKHYRLPHLGQGILGPALAIYASQPTTLPSALTLCRSVKDYLTRHILLRCDSSGDLYPVTKPSTSPIAFLSTSASMWHQRLGHPGIVKPIDRLSLNTFLISPIPKNPSDALKDPEWRNAMYDEYNALVKNGTWLLVPRPAGVNMVRSMWLFKHKFHTDGTLSRYKVRLVANGSSQQLGVDFDETFSPVVKPATIRTVLSLVVSRKWPIHQLDVKNVFLNVDLSETGSLYGLKQAPRAWFQRFAGYAIRAGFYHSRCLFLSQKKYALDLLTRAHMVNCNPSRTPVDSETKLVQQVCLYMHDPREPHFAALKRILRYVQGTLELGLHLYASATTSLVGYTDADWAGCPSTRRSTFDYCVFLGENLLSRTAKRQHTISRSSAEAEYRGVSNVVAETAWLCNLLRELHSHLFTATLVYCVNVSAVYTSANPVQHQRTKHIEIDIHFVRDMVKAGHVRVFHIPSRFQYADIFIKGLPSALFENFRFSLSVHPPPAQKLHKRSGGYCFKIIACAGGGDTTSESVDRDDLVQNKGSDKRGWSFRKKSAGQQVLSNTVITEISSSENKISEPIVINAEAPVTTPVSEKTSANQWTEELPRVSSSNTKASTVSNTVTKAIDEDAIKLDSSPDESSVILIQTAVRKFMALRVLVRLQNVVKLQAAVRGHLVRCRAAGTLRCVQAIVKMQTLVRARHANLSVGKVSTGKR
ncbi:ribonuclease H-like domain-containing protein, partial [Tanacetum coccineum]